MRLLLDENFPLALYDRLRSRGIECDHIIASGQRGMPDSQIRERLAAGELQVSAVRDGLISREATRPRGVG